MRSYFLIAIFVFFALPGNKHCIDQQLQSREGNIIVCIIELDHAGADDLAKTLKPLLSSKARLIPYQRTNTLIIKDREAIVNMLSKITSASQ